MLKRLIFILLVFPLILSAQDKVKEGAMHELKEYGIKNIALNVFMDLYHVSNKGLDAQNYLFKYPITKDKEAADAIDSVFKAMDEDRVFVDGSHPKLLSYDRVEGKSLSLYYLITFGNAPYCIRLELSIQNGKYRMQEMQLYRSAKEIKALSNQIESLPFTIKYSPEYFAPRKEDVHAEINGASSSSNVLQGKAGQFLEAIYAMDKEKLRKLSSSSITNFDQKAEKLFQQFALVQNTTKSKIEISTTPEEKTFGRVGVSLFKILFAEKETKRVQLKPIFFLKENDEWKTFIWVTQSDLAEYFALLDEEEKNQLLKFNLWANKIEEQYKASLNPKTAPKPKN